MFAVDSDKEPVAFANVISGLALEPGAFASVDMFV
jgi:hypothetical protein